uniref:Uncharacterized protein n=1 Tax=Oryza punctata TaxID=4537 RepID=A0A0E0LQP7_ORYPU
MSTHPSGVANSSPTRGARCTLAGAASDMGGRRPSELASELGEFRWSGGGGGGRARSEGDGERFPVGHAQDGAHAA